MDQCLEALYAKHKGKVSDKWTNYLEAYNKIFSEYRNHAISLLEIGIQNGGSLEIWGKYFEAGRLFVGCEIDLRAGHLRYDDSRIRVVIGDSELKETRDLVLATSKDFTIIIDDASHASANIIRNFVNYFDLVVDGGIYVIEDLCCGYWPEFRGGLLDQYSSMSFLKTLVDVVNFPYWGGSLTRAGHFGAFGARYNVEIKDELLEDIAGIEFQSGMCFIRKKAGCGFIGKRLVVGEIESLTDGQKKLHNTELDYAMPKEPSGESFKSVKHENKVYDQDGLRSSHNHDFMEDPEFKSVYERGLQASGIEYFWHWRVHVGLWVANLGIHLEGDFIECGVGKGFLASSIMKHLNWDTCHKTFYLLDTFSGLDRRYLTETELAEGALEKNQQMLEAGIYVDSSVPVKANFSEWKNVKIVVGAVPDTLLEVSCERVAFLHLDINCAMPEIAAIRYFWDKLVPGAPILLDDYAYFGYLQQKLAMDNFALEVGVKILSLPTGQGLIIKPGLHPLLFPHVDPKVLERLTKLEAEMESFKVWQERSWAKRTFHRWKPPQALP